MSKTSGDCQYPEWLAPGSSVTTIKGRYEVTEETTVERVGKRDIVLLYRLAGTQNTLQGPGDG